MRTALVVTVMALLASPASAYAGGFHQTITDAPVRASLHLGTIPLEIVSPFDKVVTLREGRRRFRATWNNITFQAGDTTFLLKILREEIERGLGDRTLVFADRALTAAERRRFKVVLDVGRDADVLVVARENPACAGLSVAQARQIAAGQITRWSQLFALPEGQPDAIDLRHSTHQRGFEQRFGVKKLPASAKGSDLAGIDSASRGDRAVAGVTSWARVRRAGNALCAVPLDGIAPSNARVHALSYPGAYPLSMVVHRKRQRRAHDRAVRKTYIAYLRSTRAQEKFRRNGMLLAAEAPPADAPAATAPSGGSEGTSGGPTRDRQGRPITPIRDDAAGRSTITGERLQRAQGSGLDERFAFDADRLLRRIERAPDGSSCRQVTGTWDVEAAWRYEEHGGGLIARVRLQTETTRTVTLELPGDEPSTGYIDGQPFSRSRELSGSCP